MIVLSATPISPDKPDTAQIGDIPMHKIAPELEAALARIEALEIQVKALTDNRGRIIGMEVVEGGKEISLQVEAFQIFDGEVRGRPMKYDWPKLEQEGVFIFECNQSEKARAMRSIVSTANARYGAGIVKTKQVGSGVKATMPQGALKRAGAIIEERAKRRAACGS